MDSSRDMLLLDGSLVLKDQGYAFHGPDKVLMAGISAVEQRHGLTRGPLAATAMSCDPEAVRPEDRVQ